MSKNKKQSWIWMRKGDNADYEKYDGSFDADFYVGGIR